VHESDIANLCPGAARHWSFAIRARCPVRYSAVSDKAPRKRVVRGSERCIGSFVPRPSSRDMADKFQRQEAEDVLTSDRSNTPGGRVFRTSIRALIESSREATSIIALHKTEQLQQAPADRRTRLTVSLTLGRCVSRNLYLAVTPAVRCAFVLGFRHVFRYFTISVSSQPWRTSSSSSASQEPTLCLGFVSQLNSVSFRWPAECFVSDDLTCLASRVWLTREAEEEMGVWKPFPAHCQPP